MSGVIVFTSIFDGRENKVAVCIRQFVLVFICFTVMRMSKNQMVIRLEHRSIYVNGSFSLFEGEENQPITIRIIVNVIVTLWKK